jgi:cytoskeletal protein CcmA (bactofilin family)
VNYFSQPKGARELKVKDAAIEPKVESRPEAPLAAKPAQDMLSTFGQGMLVTGNVVCAGALQIFGRVTGEIHAGKVVICEGAKVEGKIRAQDVVIQGEFLGTVHANSVKLQSTAKVDGEVFNKQLSIEQNALFEGVSRRLERPVEAPSADQVSGTKPAPAAPVARAPEPLTLTRPVNQPIPLSEVII